MSEEAPRRPARESFSSLFLPPEESQPENEPPPPTNQRESDIPNEYGNTSIDSESSGYHELNNETNSSRLEQISPSWEMNYHEAAIFLECTEASQHGFTWLASIFDLIGKKHSHWEGENNDKFNSHPRDRSALPAYLVTHNHWFYSLDLAAALLLMSLAVIEEPAVFEGVPVGVHGSIELFGLFLLGISIVMQLRWLGLRTFLQHKRSALKSIMWVIMIVEAVVVLIRNTSHFRVTRALRPIFFVDSRYMGGVRRFLRQILQSVPPILEVLCILFFILIIFATLGFYLFSPDLKNPYFTTFQQGFVSLYVLLTTANYPDVMMPAYAKSRWNAAFFIAFLAINLYFLMNLMLAVVFVVFSDIEKDKYRKLLLHKRKACQYAFRLLVTRSQPTHIPFRHFHGLLKFFRPHTSWRDAYLAFRALNRTETGLLTLSEFYNIYDVCEFKWKPCQSPDPWFIDLPNPLRGCCFLIRRLVLWKWFDCFINVVIVANALVLLVKTILISTSGETISYDVHVSWDQLAFVAFYTLEAILKMIGYGVMSYIHVGWNVYDFIITLLAIIGIIAEQFANSFFYVVILRPLRLLRLFRMRQRYRDVFQTLVILLPRILSAIVVIITTYYFFAIIGMELFSQYDMKNCCINTTVEQYYKDDNTTVYVNYYYLNNFDDLFIAGVTLFELTVVNNWFIIMEGYAAVASQWSRLFFMWFYLVMMVVMSVVVAFILEAFTFRMQYNQTVQEDKDADEDKVHIFIGLTKEELRFVYSTADDTLTLQQYSAALETEGIVRYEGTRRRTRVVLQRRMYRDEIPGWLLEADQVNQDSTSTPSDHPVLTTHTPPVEIQTRQQVQPCALSQTPPSFFGTLNNGVADGEGAGVGFA